MRSIIGQVRPDRQTLLFSATLPNRIDRLVQDALTSPVRVTVGEIGAANDDIRQVWLLSLLWVKYLDGACPALCILPIMCPVGTSGPLLQHASLAYAQVAEVLDDSAKWTWLKANVQGFIDQGDVLVFVSTKVRSEEVSGQLQAAGLKCGTV